MKRAFLFIYVVVTTLFSAPAASKEKPIVVTAVPTRAEWVNQVGKNLDDAIRYPHPMFGSPPSSGIVSVNFIASPDGRPAAATLVRSSRYRDLDRAALEAVNRMKAMPQLPASFKQAQTVRANILFAASTRDYDKQMKLLRAEAAASNRLAALDRDTLVLNVGSPMSGGTGARAR